VGEVAALMVVLAAYFVGAGVFLHIAGQTAKYKDLGMFAPFWPLAALAMVGYGLAGLMCWAYRKVEWPWEKSTDD